MKKRRFNNLVIEDLDPLEDVVLDEAVEDGAVDLPEELAGVELVLGDDDKAVVVKDVTLHRVVLAGDLVPALQAKHHTHRHPDRRKVSIEDFFVIQSIRHSCKF